MSQALDVLRRATAGSAYEGRLYLVGGIVRDRVLGETADEDIDIVLEGDAAELAAFLHSSGAAAHRPVTYPRFGTAMITVADRKVELVGARRESYDRASRKPSTRPGTLLDDVLRRDFTINTLLQSLHTGEVLDLTGRGMRDIHDRVLRTPLDPEVTFHDDPLRMLRAVRFACRLDFAIEPGTWQAIGRLAGRLSIISGERIRDELVKILRCRAPSQGMQMLLDSGLLAEFAPELSAMQGVTQNVYHIYDVWEHTLHALDALPKSAGTGLRLAALLHDVGKVDTRQVDECGDVHFYQHQAVGAEIARRLLHRLRFPGSLVEHAVFLISMHLRVGEYDEQWSDAAVRRLLRDAGDRLDDLITLTRADKAAANPEMPSVDLVAFRRHLKRVQKDLAGRHMSSPLDGREIMQLLDLPAGPAVGEVKSYLESSIIEGVLLPGDKAGAAELALRKFGKKRHRRN